MSHLRGDLQLLLLAQTLILQLRLQLGQHPRYYLGLEELYRLRHSLAQHLRLGRSMHLLLGPNLTLGILVINKQKVRHSIANRYIVVRCKLVGLGNTPRCYRALCAAGFPALEPKGSSQALNLNTAVVMLSGAQAMTYESTTDSGLSFDGLLESHYVMLETVLKAGLQEPFAPRNKR